MHVGNVFAFLVNFSISKLWSLVMQRVTIEAL